VDPQPNCDGTMFPDLRLLKPKERLAAVAVTAPVTSSGTGAPGRGRKRVASGLGENEPRPRAPASVDAVMPSCIA